ncbi:MAG: hypothetical protein IJB35_03285 [Oscillospiraceae bacterium]|nr:hypothetical protein [Oscillospiraceae bacterium]
MKPSVLRLICALLLMGIALSFSIALVVGAVNHGGQAQEESYLWLRLPLAAENTEAIHIYSAEGEPLQSLTPDADGKITGQLLPSGTYYAVTDYGCTEFSLSKKGEVCVNGGCGWFDGQTLHLTRQPVGTLSITSPNVGTGWRDYTLTGEGESYRRVLRSGGEESVLTCTFGAIPYGTYTLMENGIVQCRITIGAEQPNVAVSLP